MSYKRKEQKNISGRHPFPSDSAPSSTTPNNKNNSKDANAGETDTKGPSSLWNRIQSSASTLIQDTVSQPRGAALGADLAQVLSSSSHGKGSYSSFSSSSSSSSFSGLVSGPSQSANGSSSSRSWSSSSYSENAGAEETRNKFRTSTAIPAQDLSFEDSFLYGPREYEDDDSQQMGKGKGKGKGKQLDPAEADSMILTTQQETQSYNMIFNDYEMAWINAMQADGIFRRSSLSSSSSSSTALPHEQYNQAQTDQEKGQEDGAAVVSLLSNPSFQPGLVDDNTPFGAWNDDDDPADADGFPVTTLRPLMTILTADEKAIIDSFRRQSELERSQSAAAGRKSITSRSLIPDIDMFLATDSSSSGMGQQQDDDDSAALLREAVLSSLPGAEEWVGVEERYHDEVWGYLRPVMEDAARELQERKEGGGDDGPAVRRLKMILRHMRGS